MKHEARQKNTTERVFAKSYKCSTAECIPHRKLTSKHPAVLLTLQPLVSFWTYIQYLHIVSYYIKQTALHWKQFHPFHTCSSSFSLSSYCPPVTPSLFHYKGYNVPVWQIVPTTYCLPSKDRLQGLLSVFFLLIVLETLFIINFYYDALHLVDKAGHFWAHIQSIPAYRILHQTKVSSVPSPSFCDFSFKMFSFLTSTDLQKKNQQMLQ